MATQGDDFDAEQIQIDKKKIILSLEGNVFCP